MKIAVSAEALHAAVSWAARLCLADPDRPQLSGVLLEAAGNDVRCTATDYERIGRVQVPATVVEPGVALVSGRLFAAITKTLAKAGAGAVSASSATGTLDVVADRSAWSLPTMDRETWSGLPRPSHTLGQVDAEAFTEAIARVLPARSARYAEPTHGGIALTPDPAGQMVLAATDQWRLAVAEIPWHPCATADDDAPAGEELIIPGTLLSAISEAIRGTTGPVTLHHDDNLFGAGVGAAEVSGRLLTRYLPWRYLHQLTKHRATVTRVVVEVSELLGAADRAAVMVEGKQALRVEVGGADLRLSAVHEYWGTAEHSVPVLAYDGEPITFGVDLRWLREALAALGAPMAHLLFSGSAEQPFLLLPADETGAPVDDGYSHILSPRSLFQPVKAAA